MEKERAILELLDKSTGKKMYKATVHIPKLKVSDTMVFRSRAGAEAWLESYSD